MKNHRIFRVILFFSLLGYPCTPLHAQTTGIKNGAEFNASGLNVRVQFYDENIVRVIKWSRGERAQN